MMADSFSSRAPYIRRPRRSGPPWARAWLPAVALLLVTAACGSEPAGPGPTPPDGPADPTPTIAPEAVEWLKGAAFPLRTELPEGDLSDLEPLREVVGDARVVALGEATHGTAEFFHMKDRILRFLVREMGFDAFAIEATWPESNRIDEFVRTGAGDPEVLLSGLYFWTWNTREVLDMILWMREHNLQTPAEPVRFFGFDMQYPGMAIDNVERYLAPLDEELHESVSARLGCMAPYANGPDGLFPAGGYDDLPPSTRDECRDRLDEAFELLEGGRAELVAASSDSAYRHALQSLRIVLQYEDAESGRAVSARDRSMADNTLWLLDRLGPNARIVIWAHNFHISRLGGAQGRFLTEALGADYVALGFSFEDGVATAVPRNPSGALGPYPMPDPDPEGYEAHFATAEEDLFLLDMRGLAFDSPATSWLQGPRAFRQIGCCVDRSNPSIHIVDIMLPELWDAMIHFAHSSASDVLPFRYPSEF